MVRNTSTAAKVDDKVGFHSYIQQPIVFFRWVVIALLTIPTFLVPNILFAILSAIRLPGIGCSLIDGWWKADAAWIRHIVVTSLKACDSLEEGSTLDNENIIDGVEYPAVTCYGMGHKALMYFGVWYYLIVHGLVGKNTNVYGYSSGSLLALWLAVTVQQETQEQRKKMLMQGMESWITYSVEFLPNYWRAFGLTKLAGQLLFRMQEKIPDSQATATAISGRLHIILARCFSWTSPLWVVSSYSDMDEVRKAIVATTFWPWSLEIRPWAYFRGVPVIDGGFVTRDPLPAQRPCFVADASDSAAIWFDNAVLKFFGDQFRSSMPLFREKDIVADIVRGYAQAAKQHRQHTVELSKAS